LPPWQAAGLAPEPCIALPDHAPITAADLAPAAGRVLLCTEKDAVKLWPLRPDALAVPLEITLPAAFLQAFDRLLAARL
jgi:tetraacyldisaccharide 4'-kinase